MHPLTLGERLTLIRKRHRMTQRALAERIGCQQSDIHRLEAGLVTDPHMSRLVALAQALQVSTDWLAGLEASIDGAPPVPPAPPKAKGPTRKATDDAEQAAPPAVKRTRASKASPHA